MPAARSICDSLDNGASPEALVNDALAWLKTNYRNGAPSKFNGWELVDAQILYLTPPTTPARNTRATTPRSALPPPSTEERYHVRRLLRGRSIPS
jgi:hypothetical protein